MTKTIIFDNGASSIKVGLVQHCQPKVVPNIVIRGKNDGINDKRYYIADQLSECTDFSSLYYRLAFEKGYLTNWGLERTIWDRVYKHVLKVEPADTQLIITEPIFNLSSIQEAYNQIIFEEYQVNSCYRTLAPQLCVYNDWHYLFGTDHSHDTVADCCVVVDSGYSFTHIVPFLKRKPITKAIKRIDVGGKLLTNHLKETVSFRQYDLMEETYIVNDVKEECCYISQDIMSDLAIAREPYPKNTIIQEYVLPDFTTTVKGHVRATPLSLQKQKKKKKRMDDDDDEEDDERMADQQVLLMNNERFMIPEILMHPSDIGMNQAGIPETIIQSVEQCDPSLHGLLYANIILVGGNAHIPGYQQRIEKELRQMIPTDYEFRVTVPDDPTIAAWTGGQKMMTSLGKSDLQKLFVSREEYLEYGSDVCKRKFGY
ncbi:unnamed protein product [Cunninghamella echinulata]